MNDLKEFANMMHIAPVIIWVFIGMSAITYAKKTIEDFSAKILHKPVAWMKKAEQERKKIGELDTRCTELKEEIARVKEETSTKFYEFADETNKRLDAMSKVDLITCWKDIIQLGMEAIAAGHISYSDRALLNKTYEAYHGVNGNGHVKDFVENNVNVLPFTEEISEEEMRKLAISASARIKKAQLALSNYYVENGIE